MDQAYQAFTPMPNSSYQITPRNVFYLNFVDVTKGSLINTEIIGKPLTVDFETLDSPVKVIHNEGGELVIEK